MAKINNEILSLQMEKLKSDKSVIKTARQLYRDLVNLAKKKGYCYATNSYFAKEYDVTKGTVSRWVSSLSEAGYVKVDVVRDQDSNRVIERKIYLIVPNDDETTTIINDETIYKSPIGMSENDKEYKVNPVLRKKNKQEEEATLCDELIISEFEKVTSTEITNDEKKTLNAFKKENGLDLLVCAIKKSIVATYKLAYIRETLSDWNSKGITEPEQLAKKEVKQHNKKTKFTKSKVTTRTEMVPDWFKRNDQGVLEQINEKTTTKTMTDNDRATIEKMKALQNKFLNNKMSTPKFA